MFSCFGDVVAFYFKDTTYVEFHHYLLKDTVTNRFEQNCINILYFGITFMSDL